MLLRRRRRSRGPGAWRREPDPLDPVDLTGIFDDDLDIGREAGYAAGFFFFWLLSGFACAVPAILATRTMERRRDRLLTMMALPLMTCSARLPVYGLLIAAMVPPWQEGGFSQGLLMAFMYLFGTLMALIVALGACAEPDRPTVPLYLAIQRGDLDQLDVILELAPADESVNSKIATIYEEFGLKVNAAEILIKDGFQKVYNVLEGFEGELDDNHHRSTLGGWRFHDLPWEQC